MPQQPASPPPAYFLSLSLENVRSFGDKQTISFAQADGRPAQWTIILGDNGVGKTTVLKALAGMETTYIKEPGKEKRDYSPILFTLFRRRWLPSRNGKKSISIRYDYAAGSTLQGDYIDVRKDWTAVTGYVGKQGQSEGSIGSYSNYDPLEFICYGYGAGRTVGNSTIGETPANDDTCASLFDDRADLLNPEEWFLNIDYGSKLAGDNAGQLNKARNLVEEMLKTVLPGVTELRIASTGTPQKPQISLQFLLFDTWVRLRDMSLGYQTLVVWLTDFASKLFIRYPDSSNPLEEPAIVLIDEIDLHLHPSWQRKLIGFLSGIFKNTQFIATAHSPLVVQAAGDQPSGANVVLLKRVGDQTIVYQGEDLPDVRSWRLDQILSSELFDEVPVHSPDTEKKLRRRDALLAKARLTAKEKQELAELNEWDNTQPVGDSQPERKAADVLRELARKLGKQELLD